MIDKDALAQLMTAQAAAIKNLTEEVNTALTDRHGLVMVPAGFKTEDLERFLPQRRRMRGKYDTSHIASYCTYVAANDDEGGRVFIDQTSMSAVAVLNFGSTKEPGHCDNLATLTLEKTPAYAALEAICNAGRLSQQRLVTHLEDWLDFYDFMDEDGGAIVPQSAISALRNLTIETAKRAESRVTNLANEGTVFERAKAESSGGLVIPVFITLYTLLFNGLGPQKLHMRLSVDTSGDKPTLSLVYRNREQVHKDMGEEFVVLLQRELEAAGLDAGEVVLGKFHS